MKFGFSPEKSQTNKKKHGIDFVEAQDIWSDPNLIRDVPDNLRGGEQYWLAVGTRLGQLWTMIYNIRFRMIWIVSVRRSRDYEKEQYEALKD